MFTIEELYRSQAENNSREVLYKCFLITLKCFWVMIKNSSINTGWAIDREHATPLEDVSLIPQKSSRKSTYSFIFPKCKGQIKYIKFKSGKWKPH